LFHELGARTPLSAGGQESTDFLIIDQGRCGLGVRECYKPFTDSRSSHSSEGVCYSLAPKDQRLKQQSTVAEILFSESGFFFENATYPEVGWVGQRSDRADAAWIANSKCGSPFEG
jgi:hypothetical protein